MVSEPDTSDAEMNTSEDTAESRSNSEDAEAMIANKSLPVKKVAPKENSNKDDIVDKKAAQSSKKQSSLMSFFTKK